MAAGDQKYSTPHYCCTCPACAPWKQYLPQASASSRPTWVEMLWEDGNEAPGTFEHGAGI